MARDYKRIVERAVANLTLTRKDRARILCPSVTDAAILCEAAKRMGHRAAATGAVVVIAKGDALGGFDSELARAARMFSDMGWKVDK